MLYGFSDYRSSILCPAAFAGNQATTPVGTGAFTLAEAVHGDHITLKGRPEWAWGPNGVTAKTPGFPQNLIIKIIANDTTAANLLTTGAIDLAPINGPEVQRLIADKSIRHVEGKAQAITVLLFNETPGLVLADEQVRTALMTAIDRKAFNQAAFNGRGTLVPSYQGPAIACYDESGAKYIPAQSISKARSILQADGYTAGSDGKFQKNGKPLAVTLIGSSTTMAHGPEYLANQWDQAGIKVTWTDSDLGAYATAFSKGNFDAAVVIPSSSPASPGGFGVYIYYSPPPAGGNLSRGINPEADREAQLAESVTGAESCKHWANVQRLKLEHHDYVPMVSQPIDWFTRGIDLHPDVQVDPLTIRRL
jgi:peptide/nickel transport system substrate-binding protein